MIGIVLLRFVYDILRAFADALAPRDELSLRSLGLDIYRHDILIQTAAEAEKKLRYLDEQVHELAVGACPPEDFTNRIVDMVTSGNTPLPRGTPSRTRKWPLSLELTGKAGQTASMYIQPQVLFRGKKIIATDDGSRNTTISMIFVGQQSVLPSVSAANNIPIRDFAHDQINNEIKFPTCQPALTVTVQVAFQEDCTCYLTIFGDAVL